MFEYVKGTLVEALPFKAVVDVGGVGYSVFIPLNTFGKLPKIGSAILLYLTPVIREDAHKLYGFLTRAEREFFEKLIEVSGVGPKMGMALIGNLEIAELQLAIAQANIALLSKIPGVGKKTAERLTVEMRDKIKNLKEDSGSKTPASGLVADATSALTHLGYNPLQAQKAVSNVLEKAKKEPSLSELITLALRTL